jgi:hypothetical protein
MNNSEIQTIAMISRPEEGLRRNLVKLLIDMA